MVTALISQDDVVRLLTAHFPREAWFVPVATLFVLGWLAVYDAITGRVPRHVITIFFLWALGVLVLYNGWFFASMRFAIAAVIIIGLWIGNELYVKFSDRDAFGFGDVRWTALAIVVFGAENALIAWVVGAWLALGWLAVRWLTRKIGRDGVFDMTIHFVPFLFVGLLLSIFHPLIWGW